MIEWPDDEMEPTKYWLSSLELTTSLQDLVGHAKLRWRIERDYQDLKQELGLGHYEGRGWHGIPPPCNPLHRRLRTPGLREESVSPSGPSPFPAAFNDVHAATEPLKRL